MQALQAGMALHASMSCAALGSMHLGGGRQRPHQCVHVAQKLLQARGDHTGSGRHKRGSGSYGCSTRQQQGAAPAAAGAARLEHWVRQPALQALNVPVGGGGRNALPALQWHGAALPTFQASSCNAFAPSHPREPTSPCCPTPRSRPHLLYRSGLLEAPHTPLAARSSTPSSSIDACAGAARRGSTAACPEGNPSLSGQSECRCPHTAGCNHPPAAWRGGAALTSSAICGYCRFTCFKSERTSYASCRMHGIGSRSPGACNVSPTGAPCAPNQPCPACFVAWALAFFSMMQTSSRDSRPSLSASAVANSACASSSARSCDGARWVQTCGAQHLVDGMGWDGIFGDGGCGAWQGRPGGTRNAGHPASEQPANTQHQHLRPCSPMRPCECILCGHLVRDRGVSQRKDGAGGALDAQPGVYHHPGAAVLNLNQLLLQLLLQPAHLRGAGRGGACAAVVSEAGSRGRAGMH